MFSVVKVFVAGAVGLSLLTAIPLAFVGSRTPDTLPPPNSVVDLHAHVAGLGQGCERCYVSPDLLDSYKFKWYLRAFGTDAEEMQRLGDAIVVERFRDHVRESRWVKQAVLLALDGVVDAGGNLDKNATQVYVPNDYVADVAAHHEEFLFGASINPRRLDALERLEQAKRDGAVLIKWIPAIMHIDPADPELQDFYVALVALDMPLLVHVGDENAFHSADNTLGDPVRLMIPLEMGVTVIAAHIATTGDNEGEENFERLIAMLPDYPNLYTDISSLTQINKRRYLRRALEIEGLDPRMVYGSDWPLQFFPLVSRWWHFGNAPLSELRYAGGFDNPLDRDIAIKAALGVPTAVFTRAAEVLQLNEDLLEKVQ